VYEPVLEGRIIPESATTEAVTAATTTPAAPHATPAPAGENEEAAIGQAAAAAAAGSDGGSSELKQRRGQRPATAAAAHAAQPPADDIKATPSTSKPSAASRLIRRALAVQATFLFSGLWHMLIWHHHHVGGLGWRWLAFFSVQAPIMIAEAALCALWLRAWRLPPLPRWVSVPLTNFLLIVVAEPLFFGPCDWSGMCGKMLGSVKGVGGGVDGVK
jgi:hypothetical protein